MKRRGALTPAALREMRMSMGLLVTNIPMTLVMGAVWGGIYVSAHYFAWLRIETNALTIVLAFLAADLSYYWEHRCAHRVPWLWRTYHAQHHSSAAYTIATAYRVSFVNQFLAPAFYIPWILLGFSPVLMIGFALVCFHYQAWVHTEMIGRLGILDRIVNTPANHRMHHSTTPEHHDRNFGAVLLVWDRIFDSYAEPGTVAGYGIAGEVPPATAWEVYTGPWRSTWRKTREHA